SRTIYLHDGTLSERSALINHGASPVSFDLTIDFFSDFADIFEVRGMLRPARGTLHREVMGRNKVLLRYTGLDGKVRETALTFEPAPAVLTIPQAKYSVTLDPRRPWQQFISASCDSLDRPAARQFLRGLVQARRDLTGSTSTVASLKISNAVFNEIV